MQIAQHVPTPRMLIPPDYPAKAPLATPEAKIHLIRLHTRGSIASRGRKGCMLVGIVAEEGMPLRWIIRALHSTETR
jgi:hypothetical protein